MNRIEAKLNALKERNEKAFATYLTGGLPDLESTKRLIKVQEEAGTDLLEIGIPFSDPIADGPVIQQASYEAILNGANTENIFECIDEVRKDGVEIPIVFMTYFNTVLHYGIKKFVDKCSEVGVDGIIIPDLPFEEQDEIQNALNNRDETILIQLIAPVSKDRMPMILENARGFVYCVSAMGVTGEIDSFHSELANCLNSIRDNYDIPILGNIPNFRLAAREEKK